MKTPTWDWKCARWDRFKAFYMTVQQRGLKEDSAYGHLPMILFDTGEVIFTQSMPRPDTRGHYEPIDVSIVTSKELTGELYAPDGQKIAIAWLYDNGQEYLLIDHSTNRVVALGGHRSYDADTIEGLPKRFQTGVHAYIPGEGVPPVSIGKINVWMPHAKALTPEERSHVDMIVETARAGLKLTDDPVIHERMSDKTITGGCSLNRILEVSTYTDLTKGELATLYHQGPSRKHIRYDYLLTEKPE